jgi:PTH1 family peptidyl-tRNA hydrolase
MDDAIKLVVGLGNPGRQYEGTRHNIGFEVLDRLAQRAGVKFDNHLRWQAHVAKLPGGVHLLKPQTFMNLSGRSVGQALRFFKWSANQLLVVYDDVALPLGSLRFRANGSAAGHNGLKSLIEHLGTSDFPRLKLGIGASAPGEMTGHVLGKFTPEERQRVENTLATAEEAVQLALSQGLAPAANAYNVRTEP